MRRHNVSLQRPQEELVQRMKESERNRKEREPEERRKERRRKWKKWLGLADFSEYDSPLPVLLFGVYFLVFFLGGVTLCFLGLFKDPYRIQLMPILFGVFISFFGAKALILFYPIFKAIIISLFKDRKK